MELSTGGGGGLIIDDGTWNLEAGDSSAMSRQATIVYTLLPRGSEPVRCLRGRVRSTVLQYRMETRRERWMQQLVQRGCE